MGAAVVGVQDFGFMGGSMGMAVGTAFCAGAQRAINRNCGYIVVTAAGGARMQEGLLSLMQMAKARAASESPARRPRMASRSLPKAALGVSGSRGGCR